MVLWSLTEDAPFNDVSYSRGGFATTARSPSRDKTRRKQGERAADYVKQERIKRAIRPVLRKPTKLRANPRLLDRVSPLGP